MNTADVIRLSREIVASTGLEDPDLEPSNFLDHADMVRDIITSWPKKKQQQAWVRDFALGLRKLRDDFEVIVRADPMVLYKPAHKEAMAFHRSQALIRYFRAPNRSSKTQAGCADNYWVLTGQHPYRPRPPTPAAVALIAVNFSKQASSVYIPKYLEGEGGNPLSPIFPEGGAWFNRYDRKLHKMWLGCSECREKGKAAACPRSHPKSTLSLFSDQEGPLVFAGGQYAQIQFDEQISEEFLAEAMKRLETVPHAGLMVTETPLIKGFWTHRILTKAAGEHRTVPGTTQPWCTLHTLSQYDAGLTSKEMIDASKMAMSEQEAEARIYGRPSAYSKSGVFDKFQISEMIGNARRSVMRGDLFMSDLPWATEELAAKFQLEMKKTGEFLERADGSNTAKMLEMCSAKFQRPTLGVRTNQDGNLRVWEEPVADCQYVIGADVAQGLTNGDASCAQVLKQERKGYGMKLTQVAVLHGWMNSLAYALDLFKLGLWYNCAWLVPERRGPGDATIQRLKELGCWFLFRDTSDQANAVFAMDSRFGLDTNVKTKGMFVSILQQLIWDKMARRRDLEIWDEETLEELGTFGQEETASGKSITFRGESGMPDDRVMALAIGAYAALTFPLYSLDTERKLMRNAQRADTNLSEEDQRIWDELRREMRAELIEEMFHG